MVKKVRGQRSEGPWWLPFVEALRYERWHGSSAWALRPSIVGSSEPWANASLGWSGQIVRLFPERRGEQILAWRISC